MYVAFINGANLAISARYFTLLRSGSRKDHMGDKFELGTTQFPSQNTYDSGENSKIETCTQSLR